jgi:hypothetical protein
MSDLPSEPGLDRHDWETEYEQLAPLIRESPEEALPELASLVERIMDERSIAVADLIVYEETEELASFAPAKELADRARAGEDLPPGDVGFALRELRELYRLLIEERRAP